MFRIEGGDIFDQMIDDIKEHTVRDVLAVMPAPNVTERKQVATPISTSHGDTPIKKKPIVKAIKVGRNDPCPCGSGKKFKKCCGQNQVADND